MTTISHPTAGRPASLSWLPSVIAMPLAFVFGLFTLAGLAGAALDGSPDPRVVWLERDLVAQAAFFLVALGLLVTSRLVSRRQRMIAAAGWVVVALTVTAGIACTALGPR